MRPPPPPPPPPPGRGDLRHRGAASREGQDDSLLPMLSSKSKHGSRSGRGRSRNPKPPSCDTLISAPPLPDPNSFDQSIEVVKALSGQTDEIIDMEERYSSPHETVGSFFSDGSMMPAESRDDVWTDDYRKGDEGSVLSNTSSLEDMVSFDEKEQFLDPLDRLMDRFQIPDLLKGFQPGTLRTLLEVESADTTDTADEKRRRRSRSRQRMKAELKREVRLADKLERKLDEKEHDFAAKLAAQNQKLETLESKLRLQEQLFESQLEAERENWRASNADVLSKKAESLQETIETLEAKVTELTQKNAVLEQENESIKKATTEKLEELEGELLNAEAELDGVRGDRMDLLVHQNKYRFLSEIERRNTRTLEVSETRTRLLLLEEQQRAQSLAQMNKELKATVRKMSKTAGNQHYQYTGTEEKLRLMLKQKDEQLELIRGILDKPSIDTFSDEL